MRNLISAIYLAESALPKKNLLQHQNK